MSRLFLCCCVDSVRQHCKSDVLCIVLLPELKAAIWVAPVMPSPAMSQDSDWLILQASVQNARYCTPQSFHLDDLLVGIYEEIYVYRQI
eukprot:5899237-Pleurochrysis_carterae.AAC.1